MYAQATDAAREYLVNTGARACPELYFSTTSRSLGDFGETQMTSLGHLVDANKIRPDPKLIAAVVGSQRPSFVT